MGRSQSIRVSDAENLLKLAGELTEVSGDFSTRSAFMIDRLCDLLEAHVGVAAIMQRDPSRESLMILKGVEAGRLDETSQRLLRRYVQETHVKDPLIEAMDPVTRRPNTIFRNATIPDQQWYGSEFVNEVKFKMKIDDAIYSDHPLEGRDISVAFGLNRLRGDKPFGRREHTLMQLLNQQLGWFFRQLAREIEDPTPVLPPALRRVLAELLRGAPEKQIARTLGLSSFTVHDHVKKLYRHFNVSSRPELMARFIRP